MVAVHDTYAAQLSSLTRGHAIYHPHPGWDEVRLTRKDAVHIGDVGYMFMGGFQRLFNIHLLHDDPAQSPALPEYFCPLQQYSVFTSVSSPQTFCSRSIHALTVTGQVSGPMFGSGDVSFSTSTECGAILATPDCIRSRDVCNRIHYEEYMLEHVERWHALTSRMGIPARLEDLMLVTGVDLTKSWSTAVFTERQMEGSLGLGIDYTTVGGVRLAARFRWRNTQGAQVNWGPQPEHDYPGDDNWAMRSESGDGHPSSSLRPVNQKEDQAIFIRRLRVKKRSIFRGLKIEANAEPRDLDGDDPDPCTSPCLAIERGPEHEEYSDALTPILDSILGNSGAEIAIAHDDDLPGFLELISRNDVSWPEAAFCQLIGTRTVGKIRSARDDSGCSVISACDTTDPASDSTDLSSTTGAALNDLESSAIRVNNKISRRRASFRNKKPGRSTQTNSYLTAQLQQKDVLITYLKAQLPHNVGVGRYPSRTSTRRRAASYVFPRLAGSWLCSDIEIEPSALSVPHVLFYGVVSTKEVKPLFHLFFERINPSIAIFDPSLHTPASTHECSPLLFTAICAVTLRYIGHPARHQAAMMVAERAIASTFILGVNTVWDCQARALVGAYSMSTRGFKKDSAWMFFDLASNLANSCNLYKISATTSIDSANTSTWEAREALNGKRTWAFCFHLARVMATLAKKPVVTRNESTAVEDAGWYSGSIANGPYDVYLAASTSIMDAIASFYSEMVSIEKGTMQMQSRGTSLRLYATALSYNDKITSTESIWNQRFLSGLVLADPAVTFRRQLYMLNVCHSRLYIFAMSFPKMFRLDEQIGIDLLDKGVFTAFDVIGSIAQMESQSDYLRFASDEVFLFGTFAADFLLEALLPKYQKFIEQERRSSICLAVKLLIDTLNSPRLDLGWQHSPKSHAIRLEQSSIFYRNLLLQKSAPTFTVDARTAPPAPS